MTANCIIGDNTIGQLDHVSNVMKSLIHVDVFIISLKHGRPAVA
jgi:hypothetical protein